MRPALSWARIVMLDFSSGLAVCCRNLMWLEFLRFSVISVSPGRGRARGCSGALRCTRFAEQCGVYPQSATSMWLHSPCHVDGLHLVQHQKKDGEAQRPR